MNRKRGATPTWVTPIVYVWLCKCVCVCVCMGGGWVAVCVRFVNVIIVNAIPLKLSTSPFRFHFIRKNIRTFSFIYSVFYLISSKSFRRQFKIDRFLSTYLSYRVVDDSSFSNTHTHKKMIFMKRIEVEVFPLFCRWAQMC